MPPVQKALALAHRTPHTGWGRASRPSHCILVSWVYIQPFDSLQRNAVGQEAYKQRTRFPRGSGDGESESQAPADSVPGENQLPGSQTPSSPCPHVIGGKLSGVPCRKALILSVRAPLPGPKHLPKAPRPNTVTAEIRFRHMHVRGPQHSVCRHDGWGRQESSSENFAYPTKCSKLTSQKAKET